MNRVYTALKYITRLKNLQWLVIYNQVLQVIHNKEKISQVGFPLQVKQLEYHQEQFCQNPTQTPQNTSYAAHRV